MATFIVWLLSDFKLNHSPILICVGLNFGLCCLDLILFGLCLLCKHVD